MRKARQISRASESDCPLSSNNLNEVPSNRLLRLLLVSICHRSSDLGRLMAKRRSPSRHTPASCEAFDEFDLACVSRRCLVSPSFTWAFLLPAIAAKAEPKRASPEVIIRCTTGSNTSASARLDHVMLPIHNSSIHRFSIAQGATQMTSYNGTPHLDAADRRHARTVI